MSASDALIHARGLTKRFGALTAVDGIDFDVAPGEAFGFLGPNGAGKSSTMRMIGCVSPPTAGTLRILDLDPVRDGPEIRGRLGVVPQADTLDNDMSVPRISHIMDALIEFTLSSLYTKARNLTKADSREAKAVEHMKAAVNVEKNQSEMHQQVVPTIYETGRYIDSEGYALVNSANPFG